MPSSESNRIWSVDVKKRDPGLFYGRNEIWYRGRNAVYWIRQFDAGEMDHDSSHLLLL
jgi:hypothetical protein